MKQWWTCHNPSLGLTTKARVCKGAGQDWAQESHFMLPEVQKSVKEWTFTLPSELPFWDTTTTGGYFVIQISSQTTKKEVSENSLLRTTIPRKLLSFCDTITFAPVQLQVLHNSRTWYNRKTFLIITASIHCLRLTLHRKLFATNPSPQQLSESTQKFINFRYKI